MTQLQKQLKEAYEDYVRANKKEPLYVDVAVKYFDDNNEDHSFGATIKLTEDVEEKYDDVIFFYCRGIDDLLSLCEKGVEDFVITDFFGYFYNDLTL